MADRYSRAEILERLRAEMARGRPLLGAGSSAGLIAKCAEIGGADLIVVYSTGRSRFMGLPTSWLGDSNQITLQLFDEIDNVVQSTPIIAGVEAHDPTHYDLEKLLTKFHVAGYSGIINFPTLGGFPERDRQRDTIGLGYSRDIEMIRVADSLDIFSLAYVFGPEHAAAMAAAGTDCIAAHVGWTTGGLAGAQTEGSLEEDLRAVEEMFKAARSEHADVICLAHGGRISTPSEARILYQQTTAQGFVGASSIERIPVEEAVVGVVRAFKASR